MADDFATKAWVQSSLNEIARARVNERIDREGRALPCRVVSIEGAMVTVAFELDSNPYTLPNIELPKAESPWVRMATQPGDKGLTLPANVYLGHISGLGARIPNIEHSTDLADLVFVPVSNANSPPPNINASTIQGPDGAIIRTTQGSTQSNITVDQSGITLTYGGSTIKLDSSGVYIQGKKFLSHEHTGIQPGSSDTGGVA